MFSPGVMFPANVMSPTILLVTKYFLFNLKNIYA